MPQRKPKIRVIDKTKRGKPYGPTILVFLLVAFGIFLILSDYAVPITFKTDWFEITTKSVGLVVIAIAVWFASDIIRHPIKKGYDVGMYDIIRNPNMTTVKCSVCGSDIPIAQTACPSCGHKRPLF